MKVWNKTIVTFVLIGALSACVYLVFGIVRSTSSTAAVGILFLPFFAALGGLAGGIVGFVVDSLWQVCQKKISLLSWQILLSLGVVVLAVMSSVRWNKERAILERIEKSEVSEQELVELYGEKYLFFPDSILQEIIKSPKITVDIQKSILASGNLGHIGRLAENANIADEVFMEIVKLAPSYQVHYAVAGSPKLNAAQVEHLLINEASRFASVTEFQLYQTYVLTKLVNRKDLTPEQFRKIVTIAKPEAFLLYALLASPHLGCTDFAGFSSHDNPVLETAIQTKREQLGCK